jgi:hypothetical protein
MRRLSLALFGTAILTIGAGSVPAAAASPQPAGVSSPSQTTANAQQCSTDDENTYGVRVCVALVSSTFVGQATVHAPPLNCAGYRVTLYDFQTGEAVASTSLRPCSESPSKQVTADASRFPSLAAYADFMMYDSAGGMITDQDTHPIFYS